MRSIHLSPKQFTPEREIYINKDSPVAAAHIHGGHID